MYHKRKHNSRFSLNSKTDEALKMGFVELPIYGWAMGEWAFGCATLGPRG